MTALPRSFHYFLWTRFAGNGANNMLLVALGWQMYDLTGSAWNLGLVGLYQFLPAIVLTVPAGQLVDRVDRRKVLGAGVALLLAAAVVLTLGTYQGWIRATHIFALCFVLGTARALQAPAQQALVPQIVTPAQLPRALALSTAMIKISTIAGPAVGGFLYAAGASIAYATCAGLCAVSLAFVFAIRKPVGKTSRGPVTFATLLAGFHFIGHHKVILGAISLDLFAVVLGGVTALLPMYAKDVLQAGPWGLGLLRASAALGGVAMAFVLARRPIERRVGHWMFGAVAVYGAAIFGFAFSTVFALSFALLFVSGAADMVSVVIRQSLVQLETPDEMRGRVSAVNGTFIQASNQLGEFRAGALAAMIGPVGSVIAGALGTLAVVALWSRLFPMLVHRDRLTTK